MENDPVKSYWAQNESYDHFIGFDLENVMLIGQGYLLVSLLETASFVTKTNQFND